MPADQSQKRRRDLLEAIMLCPFILSENTIPAAGIESAPDQAVGTLHLSLEKYRLLVRELQKLLNKKRKE